jgi:hypothetical protein
VLCSRGEEEAASPSLPHSSHPQLKPPPSLFNDTSSISFTFFLYAINFKNVGIENGSDPTVDWITLALIV